MKTNLLFVFILAFLLQVSCNKNTIQKIESRDFKMGFSTWSYGPDQEDRDNNYQLIKENGDIYSEQIDDLIPWNAWINGEELPHEFVEDIAYRVAQKTPDHQVILSISPLNTDRSDLIGDRDGSGIPAYNALNDEIIENAYVAHVSYLVDQFVPDYLIISMEASDLLKNAPEKWEEYKLLMKNVRTRIKTKYPALKLSESVVLHNWYKPSEVDNPELYSKKIKDYVAEFDFAAISYYPFFKDQHTSFQFQRAFDFLHRNVNIPIAFTETTNLAEDLNVESYDISLSGNEAEQNDYLETLLANANRENYLFVIWWTYRDYDELWETFDEEIKDIGKIWRDTGLEDENGNKRPAYEKWDKVFSM